MTNKLIAAAQQALEFVTSEHWGTVPYMDGDVYSDAKELEDYLRAALAQAEPLTPEWIWSWLMDWCKQNGTSPANYDSLFKMVSDARAAQAEPELEQHVNCTRSHPHENMDDYCKLRTEIARLVNENARLKAALQPVPAWADKAMELATDFAIESLRVGSYERKDLLLNNGCYTWKTSMLRDKREAARERLRRYLYTAQPQRKPLTDDEVKQVFTDANGRKYINNEPRLSQLQQKPITDHSPELLELLELILADHDKGVAQGETAIIESALIDKARLLITNVKRSQQ